MIVKHSKLVIVIFMLIFNMSSISSKQTILNKFSSPELEKHQNLTINDIIHVISKKITEMGIPKEEVVNEAFWNKIHDNIIISAKAMDEYLGEKYGALIVDGVVKNVKNDTIYSHPTYRRYQKLHTKVISSTQQYTPESKTLHYFNPLDKKSRRTMETLNRKESLIRNITAELLHTLHTTKGLRLDSKEEFHTSLIKTVNIINNNLLQTAIKVQKLKTNTNKKLTRRSFFNIGSDCDCDCISNYFCTKINSIYNSKCAHNSKILDIEDICDAKVDCADWADENVTICGDIILKKIQQSNDYVEDLLFLANYCRLNQQSEDMLVESLQKILVIQTKYLDKYQLSRRMNWHLDKVQALNQAAKLIKELGQIMDKTLCVKILNLNTTINPQKQVYNELLDSDNSKNVNDKVYIIRRRFNNDANDILLNDDDDSITDIEVTDNRTKPDDFPRNCKCSGGRDICLKGCDSKCLSFCERLFNLGKVVCFINNMHINVHQLCDGVVDCIDGGDESCDRSVFKEDFIDPTHFEIIDLLENKLLRALVDNAKLQEFDNHLKLLLKLMKDEIKDEQFIELRNVVFAELPEVYEDVIRQKTNKGYEEEILNNFMIINEKLVQALKNYRNGYNDIDIASKICVCAHNKCAVPTCDMVCNITCTVTSIFLRFSCASSEDDGINEFVPINSICNGKSDCGNGFDEANCKKGRCQKKDLLYIKHDVQNIMFSESKKMMLMFNKIFASWIYKNILLIDNVINVMKPSKIILKHVIRTTITGLASTFATLNEAQRNNKTIQTKFVDASQGLLTYLKNCET